MVEIVWTDPAVGDLEAIADYIAIENPMAAQKLVSKVLAHVGQLQDHPESGSFVPETLDKRYRQIIENPCRVIYRFDGERIFIVHVMRAEQLFNSQKLLRE